MSRFGLYLVKLLCLVHFCGQLTSANVDLLQWTGRCCVKGTRKMVNNPGQQDVCESDDLDRRSMSRLTRIICRHAERVCCVREMKKRNCDLGKYHAFQGQSCAKRRDHVGGDTFRECCDCCTLGIRAHSMGVTRDWVVRSAPCDQVFKECLKGNASTGLPAEVTTAAPITVPTASPAPTQPRDSGLKTCDQVACQQVCRYSPAKGAVCYCTNGYMIHSDGRSCTDVNECAYPNICPDGYSCKNEPGSYKCLPVSPASCGDGHEKINGKCEDIDECSSDDANECSVHSHCVNTVGSYECKCIKGYKGDGRTCQDVNECTASSVIAPCGSLQECVNTIGSYRCRCRRGYKAVAGSARDCQDIDECTFYQKICSAGHTCNNKPGTYQCLPKAVTCDVGREKKNGKCQDIDECSTGRADCGSLQTCINNDGSYSCQCRAGYGAVPGSSRDCQDVDECILGRHNCQQGTVCRNIAGSFRCQPIPQCGSGKRYQNSQCVDINECTELSSACPSDEICKNTQGSYVCECRASHTRNANTGRCEAARSICDQNTCRKGTQCREYGNQYRCEDIDECQKNISKCSVNEQCRNTVGSYSCQCLTGYTRNPTTQKCEVFSPCSRARCPGGHRCVAISDRQYRCEDIDECTQSPSVCKADEQCLNRPGYYFCRCPRGYEKRGDKCQDRDECRANICQHNCRNTDGSYVCTCRDGFKLSSDKRSCLDIDECQDSPCDHKCYNQYGRYRCACNRGFKLASDGHTCTDIDECERQGSNKICMYRCQNTPGSYRCTCPPGYQAFTWACSDIDECKTPGTCSDPQTHCFNTYGGYRCLPNVVCPEFFQKAYVNKCQKRCPPERNERCENIVDKSYAQYSYSLRSKTKPFRLFSYQIFLSGYINPPLVRYNFSSGNDDGAFEIRNLEDYKAEVWQTHPIVGPKSYRLSFDGEVVDNGKLISRYVNQMYIFVSANEI